MNWVLMDIGNILWCDDSGDAFTLANIGEALRACGIGVGDIDLAREQAAAVADRAPSAWRRVIDRLTHGDERLAAAVRAEVLDRWRSLDPDVYRAWTTPFPSSAELVKGLAAGGHRLLLASNNEERALRRLDELGLLEHFDMREVSETLGVAKPDPRFFAAILEASGAVPTRALMIGDRLGNDIAPTKALGMKTLRLRVGSHASQQPKDEKERPDLTVEDPAELLNAAISLLSPAS